VISASTGVGQYQDRLTMATILEIDVLEVNEREGRVDEGAAPDCAKSVF